jgi:RNA polymerase sigma-70 factor (ECF subfamily)
MVFVINAQSSTAGSTPNKTKKLYQMRAQLVKTIDPLRSEGHELQEILLNCNRMVVDELDKSEF